MLRCKQLDVLAVNGIFGTTEQVERSDIMVVSFAFSTFDTDYLLVKVAEFQKAVAALQAAGHEIESLPETVENQ